MALVLYYPYLYIGAAQYQQPAYRPQYHQPLQAPFSQNQQDNINQSQGWHRRFDRKLPNCDPMPVSCAQLLPCLIRQGVIMPKEIPPATFPYHARHNHNALCVYHARHIGHSTVGLCNQGYNNLLIKRFCHSL